MIRILFVDDEAMVLQGLQRSLRPFRNDWSMEFAVGPERALQILGERTFDVVVSDLRMANMDGAELLREVARRQPRAARVVLSGHADEGLVLRSMESAHQFVSKPCDPEVLKAVITRLVQPGPTPISEELRGLVSGMRHIPSLPVLYGAVVLELDRPGADLTTVAELVAQDIAMSAEVLKLVNSAYFGLSRPIGTILDAMTHLGVESVRTVILALHTFSQFESLDLGGLDLEAVRRHSLKVSRLAHDIALRAERGEHEASVASTAGLLHDVGKLILAANLPSEYGMVQSERRDVGLSYCQAEKVRFGASHAEVGGCLLALWSLPSAIVDAVTFHHSPGSSPLGAKSTAILVQLADWLAHCGDFSYGPGQTAPVDWDFARAEGLTEFVLAMQHPAS